MTSTTFKVANRLVANDPHALDDAKRVELYGIEPLNPFTRLRSDLGVSLNRLATICHVDRKALSRLENGTYTNPLPSMVDFWVNRGSATEGELLTDYEEFQFLQRRRHEFYLGPSLNVDLAGMHPLRQLRFNRPSLVSNEPLPVGISEFSEALCLPLDTVQYFEKKWRQQQSVPKQIKLVFNQIGYSREAIATFEQRYKQWRELNKVSVVVSNG